MRCAAGRPNPQLMSALLSEESRLYSLVFSNDEFVPVKGFQEKRHRHGQSCFISFPRIPHRSLISLFLFGGIFSLLVPLWAPALCLISGSRLTSTSERKYDRSFEGLILSSLSLSAPHLVSFTSFFFFLQYTWSNWGQTTAVWQRIFIEGDECLLFTLGAWFVPAFHFMAYHTCVSVSVTYASPCRVTTCQRRSSRGLSRCNRRLFPD